MSGLAFLTAHTFQRHVVLSLTEHTEQELDGGMSVPLWWDYRVQQVGCEEGHSATQSTSNDPAHTQTHTHTLTCYLLQLVTCCEEHILRDGGTAVPKHLLVQQLTKLQARTAEQGLAVKGAPQ